jgi:hypothetical protein
MDVLLQFSKGVNSSQFILTSKLSVYLCTETMVTSITSFGLHSKWAEDLKVVPAQVIAKEFKVKQATVCTTSLPFSLYASFCYQYW